MSSKPEIALPELSDLIGAIYDCAIDPTGWTEVLRRICGAIDGNTSALYLVDLAGGEPRLFAQWGMPEAAARAWRGEFARDVSALHSRIAGRAGPNALAPHVYSRLFSADERAAMRVHRDWAIPLGICDVVGIPLAAAASRVGMLATTRHETVGLATERELAVARLLAPHVQQAVSMGEVIDLRRQTTAALAATLDGFSIAIMIVDTDMEVLHVNGAGARLLSGGRWLRATGGRLTAVEPAAAPALATAVSSVQSKLAPAAGLQAIDLASSGEPACFAHVLPLNLERVRTRLAPRHMAAVLVMETREADPALVDAVATTYRLTPAERRLLGPTSRGLDVDLAARELGISKNTVKSQLKQIFKKFGVSRQAELVALLSRLAPAVVASPPSAPTAIGETCTHTDRRPAASSKRVRPRRH